MATRIWAENDMTSISKYCKSNTEDKAFIRFTDEYIAN